LGGSLDSRQGQRAGLGYWDQVDLQIWENFEGFCIAMSPCDEEMALFTKSGNRSFWEMPTPRRMFLVFGSETGGLPQTILDRFPQARFRIPTTGEIRSLNLSTAAGIALYESLREGR
jgi:tRNA (cytidine/uridine-2'-O-)-methyltransferase